MMDDSGDRVEEHVEALDGGQQDEGDPKSNEGSQKPDEQGKAPEPKGIRNDEAHLVPSRYWFASSAFPMIAATLGPVASAFSVCALVRPWRQNFPPGSDIDTAQFIDDPIWLTVINAIQLAVALIANLIFLLNMAKRIRFTVAQPITIVTWYISSICLVALCATASGPLIKEPQSQYIWTGAFYYGIYAACLYFSCSSLMVVTFWGAHKNYYSKDFQLTTSQRTLMLQTIMFLVYLFVGALVFSTIEGWAYLDAVYWADVTLFTVGFGDYAAATPLGRALLFPYALIGVISLGLVVGSIRSLVLERGRRHLGARITEKERRRRLRRMMKRGKDDILIPVTDDEGDGSDLRQSTSLTEFERRHMEFQLMRKIQAKAEARRRWMAMGISTTVWLMLWMVGAAIFQQCEVTYQGWTYFDGFYFAFVSLTTIGYGDVTPISPAGKSFFVFWSLLALPTTTVLISNAGDTVVKLIREWTDWLGVVTILPGERGFRKEIKLVLRALSVGRLFTDDSDIEDSPPGFLGESEKHDIGEGDNEEDEEKNIAEEGGRQRQKSTGKLEEEIRDITGIHQTARDERQHSDVSDEASDTVVNGETPASVKSEQGEYNSLHPAPMPPAERIQRSNTPPVSRPSTGHGIHLSFKEPERPLTSSGRKGRSSVQISRGDSIFRDEKSRSGSRSRAQTRRNSASKSEDGLKLSRVASIPRTGAQLPKNVPDNQHDYLVVLVDEIRRVTQHMKSHPPRKYSFEEWAWFLKLIGEDEGSAETHKKPIPKQRGRKRQRNMAEHRDGGDMHGPEDDDPDRLQWSWVGSRSPLMGSQEEAEWILDHLEDRLAEELMSMRAEAHGRGSQSQERQSATAE